MYVINLNKEAKGHRELEEANSSRIHCRPRWGCCSPAPHVSLSLKRICVRSSFNVLNEWSATFVRWNLSRGECQLWADRKWRHWVENRSRWTPYFDCLDCKSQVDDETMQWGQHSKEWKEQPCASIFNQNINNRWRRILSIPIELFQLLQEQRNSKNKLSSFTSTYTIDDTHWLTCVLFQQCLWQWQPCQSMM